PIPGGNEFEAFKAGNWNGWLDAGHAPVRLGGDYTASGLGVPDPAAAGVDREARESLRRFLSRKFANERHSAAASGQNAAFERLRGLMASSDLFDLERLPAADRERYGPGSFAQHSL